LIRVDEPAEVRGSVPVAPSLITEYEGQARGSREGGGKVGEAVVPGDQLLPTIPVKVSDLCLVVVACIENQKRTQAGTQSEDIDRDAAMRASRESLQEKVGRTRAGKRLNLSLADDPIPNGEQALAAPIDLDQTGLTAYLTFGYSDRVGAVPE
jgi:hypothetical protein